MKEDLVSTTLANLADKVADYHSRLIAVERDLKKEKENQCNCNCKKEKQEKEG